MSHGMKLYVWTGVFTDYTSGMAVALARSKHAAIEAVVRTYPYPDANGTRAQLKQGTLQVFAADRQHPIAFMISGGG